MNIIYFGLPLAIATFAASFSAAAHEVGATDLAARSAVPMAADDESRRERKLQVGAASWYEMGRRTANGEAFNPAGLTAAHRSLPFGTKLRVVNQRNGRSVVVRINDRGPFVGNRVIDLARGAAESLGMTETGVTRVALYQVE